MFFDRRKILKIKKRKCFYIAENEYFRGDNGFR